MPTRGCGRGPATWTSSLRTFDAVPAEADTGWLDTDAAIARLFSERSAWKIG